jgi:hypothetical protein
MMPRFRGARAGVCTPKSYARRGSRAWWGATTTCKPCRFCSAGYSACSPECAPRWTLESELAPLERYTRAIACFYGAGRDPSGPPRVVFVATDDSRAVPELSALLGPDYDFVTLAASSDRGHEEYSFNGQSPGARWREFVTFWATLELLARSDLFVSSQESNVFRIAHLMRLGRPANSSVSVHTMSEAGATCCAGPLPRIPKWIGSTGPCVYDCTA